MKAWWQKHARKLMSGASAMAIACAFTWMGRACTTFFYEPKAPQKLIDMDR